MRVTGAGRVVAGRSPSSALSRIRIQAMSWESGNKPPSADFAVVFGTLQKPEAASDNRLVLFGTRGYFRSGAHWWPPNAGDVLLIAAQVVSFSPRARQQAA